MTGFILCWQIPIVDDEMKKAAGEVKEDGKSAVSYDDVVCL